jgi:ubiquinone/menaquinone biosynthesis C-methylase UbiE
MDIFEEYLSCVKCGSSLKKNKMSYVCVKCGNEHRIKNGIFECLGKMETEKNFSRQKWDDFYTKFYNIKSCLEEYDKIKDDYERYGVKQLKKYADFGKKSVYLEIGCGMFFLGSMLARDCNLVIGIDFSYPALMCAKKLLEAKGIKNYILIHGDIFKMPIKNRSVDILYGGGVIEHFKNTDFCIKENARVMKNKGVAINAVPFLNLASLSYRQVWGNIPDLPILKQIAEVIHIKLLKGKHMYFGYELSFTKGKMNRLHKKHGFKTVKFFRLETDIKMDFLPKRIRPLFRYIAKNYSWFWPMMLVVAKK